jgi:hypothetical protein
MAQLSAAALEDPDYYVPPAGSSSATSGWRRNHIARFSDGEAHERHRELVEQVIIAVVVGKEAY